MVDLTEYDFAERRFFGLVNRPKLHGGSLEDASGKKLVPSSFRSSLVERVETAWAKPYAQLTCHEVCCLAGQKMILDWFAQPLLEFVKRYPAADCGYYPGDMLANFLRGCDEVADVIPTELKEWAQSDLETLEPIFAGSRPALREFREALQSLRQVTA